MKRQTRTRITNTNFGGFMQESGDGSRHHRIGADGRQHDRAASTRRPPSDYVRPQPEAIQRCIDRGALGAHSLADFVKQVTAPRVIWLMVPSGNRVDTTIEQLLPNLSQDDIIIDGGNSYYKDSIRRAEKLKAPLCATNSAGTL